MNNEMIDFLNKKSGYNPLMFEALTEEIKSTENLQEALKPLTLDGKQKLLMLVTWTNLENPASFVEDTIECMKKEHPGVDIHLPWFNTMCSVHSWYNYHKYAEKCPEAFSSFLNEMIDFSTSPVDHNIISIWHLLNDQNKEIVKHSLMYGDDIDRVMEDATFSPVSEQRYQSLNNAKELQKIKDRLNHSNTNESLANSTLKLK